MRRGSGLGGGVCRAARLGWTSAIGTTRTGALAAPCTSAIGNPANWRSAVQCATQLAVTDCCISVPPQLQDSSDAIVIACAIDARSIAHAASTTLACAKTNSAISRVAARRTRYRFM